MGLLSLGCIDTLPYFPVVFIVLFFKGKQFYDILSPDVQN